MNAPKYAPLPVLMNTSGKRCNAVIDNKYDPLNAINNLSRLRSVGLITKTVNAAATTEAISRAITMFQLSIIR